VDADTYSERAFRYESGTGEIPVDRPAAAGYGKVAVVDELRASLPVGYDSLVYVGDAVRICTSC